MVSVVSVLIVIVPLEELDRALVLFRGRARRERAKVLALPRFRICFPRIETVLAGAELPDHWSTSALLQNRVDSGSAA